MSEDNNTNDSDTGDNKTENNEITHEMIDGPKLWSRENEKILQDWGEAATCYRYMNFRAYLLYKNLSMIFQLPIIFFSTITGTANFAQDQFPASIQASVPAMIGGINIISGLLATVMQFLKINELMERHNIGSQEWGKFSREIRLELSLPPDERSDHGKKMVRMYHKRYDNLVKEVPPVPSNILKKFEKDLPGEPGINTPEILEIHRISPYKIVLDKGIKKLSYEEDNIELKEIEKEMAKRSSQLKEIVTE